MFSLIYIYIACYLIYRYIVKPVYAKNEEAFDVRSIPSLSFFILFLRIVVMESNEFSHGVYSVIFLCFLRKFIYSSFEYLIGMNLFRVIAIIVLGGFFGWIIWDASGNEARLRSFGGWLSIHHVIERMNLAGIIMYVVLCVIMSANPHRVSLHFILCVHER